MMRVFLRVIERCYEWILKFFVFLGGMSLVFLMLIVSLNVCLRYFFGHPLSWVGEVSCYILLYLPFLVGAWILKRDGHVKMDLLYNYISVKNRYVLDTITSLIGTVICSILTVYGFKVCLYLAKMHFITPTTLMLPKSLIISVIFIGFFLMTIQFLIRFFQNLNKIKTKKLSL